MWLRNNALLTLALLASVLTSASIALIFFYAPVDEDGLNQKIFYVHVPLAFAAYVCFGWGALKAFMHLWKRPPGADLESYVAVHQGVIFAAMTLLTGSIWAKISWGHWWVWSERQLVLFLILFLFYAAYFMLRYSVEAGPQRANLCAVYALFGVVLVPISFLAIRLSESVVHPTPLVRRGGPDMAGSQLLTVLVSIAGMLALAAFFYRLELAGKRLDVRLKELREALA